MISPARKIIFYQKQSSLNSAKCQFLLFATNRMLRQSTHHYMPDEIHTRHLMFGIGNLQNFQSNHIDVTESKPLVTVKEDEEEYYATKEREFITIRRTMNAMYQVATQCLVDEELIRKHLLVTLMWEEEDTCYDYWSKVLEHSKTPLANELRRKLQDSGTSHQDFSRSMVNVYYTLGSQPISFRSDVEITSEDVITLLDRLKVVGTEYEHLRILFNLHPLYGWKI